jgi:SAM-dependent methyltransferase
MKSISCDLCGSQEFRLLYTTKDRYFPIEGSFQLVKCWDCGLLYLNPQPEAQDLKRHYPTESYYSYTAGQEESNIIDSGKLDLLRTLRERIVKALSRLLPTLRSELEKELTFLGPIHSGMRVLDIGCGVGDSLSFYKEKGADTYGVEINTEACEQGRKKGHKMFCGQLSEAKFADGFFDIVRFHHSLEHIFSPTSALKETHRILKRGGRVWICVPNHHSLQAKIFGEWFYAIESPRHLFGFSPKNIIRLLNKTGFRTEHLHTHSLPGGPCFSLEYWLNDHFKRAEPFYYGKIKVKWWYIAAEPLLFLPRLLVNLFRFGEILVVCGSKP